MDANTITILIACVTGFTSIIAGVIVAVWAVASIKATTSTLAISINHLAASMNEHRKWLSRVDSRVDEHDVKFATIETHIGLNNSSTGE